MAEAQKPARPIKVVELADFVAGPYCGKLMADFGAEVVKIEKPGVGDAARRRGPFFRDEPNPETSGTFLYLNTDKLSVTLDIETEDGRALFRRLVADADILIEDRAPGEMQRLGLGYAALAALNPGLIMVSITPFGQAGPYRDFKAHPLNLYHASGQGYLLPMWSKTRERAPVRGPGFLGEFDAGMAAATAAMAALFWRDNGGTGQHVDISRQHTMLHLERSQLRRYVDTGVTPNRTGKGRLLESLVQTKDGDYVIVILSSEQQWQGLYEAMGRPAWGAREPFNTQAGRSEHHEELHRLLNEWAGTKTADEIFHAVQANNSACSPIQTAEQIYHSPQFIERGYFTEVEHPLTGRLSYPGTPFRFSNRPAPEKRHAPLLGEHTAAVLGERLAVGADELVRLRQAGAI